MTLSRRLPFSHPAYGLVWSAAHQGFRARLGATPDAVVVSGRGKLEVAGGDRLGGILSDLIEGQGKGSCGGGRGDHQRPVGGQSRVGGGGSGPAAGARMIVVDASGDVRSALNDPGSSSESRVSGGPLR